MHYVNYISAILMRMRSLIGAIVGLYVLTLLALTVYPFEPAAVLKTLMTILLLFVAAIVAIVYAGVHRDAIVSRISDTSPGELGVDFWLRMAGFVALPLFSLAAAQFPEIGRFLFSWIQPALQAAK